MPGCGSLPPPKCLPWKLPPGANVPLSIPLWLDDRKDIQPAKKRVPHVRKGSLLEQMEEEKPGESSVVGSAGKCPLNWRWWWVLKVPGGDDGDWLWWWRYLEEAVLRLNCRNRFTAEHFPLVLGQLLHSIEVMLSSVTLSTESQRQMKMISLTARSLLASRPWCCCSH